MVQNAAEEQLRERKIVKVGAIQTQIVIPTSEPIQKQVKIEILVKLKFILYSMKQLEIKLKK